MPVADLTSLRELGRLARGHGHLPSRVNESTCGHSFVLAEGTRMRFARWVFRLAGNCGVLMMLPLYAEDRFFQEYPPAINRPEFYYGFVGVTLAWQFLFLVIGSDPVRYRPAMLPAMVEKVGFAVAVPLLYHAGRVTLVWLGFAAMDATWLLLFVVAYLRTPAQPFAEGTKL